MHQGQKKKNEIGNGIGPTNRPGKLMWKKTRLATQTCLGHMSPLPLDVNMILDLHLHRGERPSLPETHHDQCRKLIHPPSKPRSPNSQKVTIQGAGACKNLLIIRKNLTDFVPVAGDQILGLHFKIVNVLHRSIHIRRAEMAHCVAMTVSIVVTNGQHTRVPEPALQPLEVLPAPGTTLTAQAPACLQCRTILDTGSWMMTTLMTNSRRIIIQEIAQNDLLSLLATKGKQGVISHVEQACHLSIPRYNQKTPQAKTKFRDRSRFQIPHGLQDHIQFDKNRLFPKQRKIEL